MFVTSILSFLSFTYLSFAHQLKAGCYTCCQHCDLNYLNLWLCSCLLYCFCVYYLLPLHFGSFQTKFQRAYETTICPLSIVIIVGVHHLSVSLLVYVSGHPEHMASHRDITFCSYEFSSHIDSHQY